MNTTKILIIASSALVAFGLSYIVYDRIILPKKQANKNDGSSTDKPSTGTTNTSTTNSNKPKVPTTIKLTSKEQEVFRAVVNKWYKAKKIVNEIQYLEKAYAKLSKSELLELMYLMDKADLSKSDYGYDLKQTKRLTELLLKMNKK